jgi:hypothetical protein
MATVLAIIGFIGGAIIGIAVFTPAHSSAARNRNPGPAGLGSKERLSS